MLFIFPKWVHLLVFAFSVLYVKKKKREEVENVFRNVGSI